MSLFYSFSPDSPIILIDQSISTKPSFQIPTSYYNKNKNLQREYTLVSFWRSLSNNQHYLTAGKINTLLPSSSKTKHR